MGSILVLFGGLSLAACSGSRPAPKPPASPAPTLTPAPLPPEATASPRPPKPEPTKEPAPLPPEVPKPGRLTICHAFDRTEEGDRVWLTLTLPRGRAEWHLQAHKSKEPGKGDYSGPCKARES